MSNSTVSLTSPPFRIADTRVDNTPPVKLACGSTLEVFVPGLIGQDVTGTILNVTITNTEGQGFLRVDASNATTTNDTSNVNWFANGQTIANLVMVPAVGTRGITVTAAGTGRTDVVIDLVGFFTNP